VSTAAAAAASDEDDDDDGYDDSQDDDEHVHHILAPMPNSTSTAPPQAFVSTSDFGFRHQKKKLL